MAGNDDLRLSENQWQVLHEVMRKTWETLNGIITMPPKFPKEVINALDQNIRIIYFDLLRLYDIAAILERAALQPGFRGMYGSLQELNQIPVNTLKNGDFAYLMVSVSPNTTTNIWTWNILTNQWEDTGKIVPSDAVPASITMPLPNTLQGAVGSIYSYALANHSHPFSAEFNNALEQITNLLTDIQTKYVKPSAGIPIADLDPQAQQKIMLRTLWFSITTNLNNPTNEMKTDDLILNGGTQLITVGNVCMPIGAIARIILLDPFTLNIVGNIRGEKGKKGDQGIQGDHGNSGVTVPVSGFYTLSVDENSDLWVEYANDVDLDECPFELDEDGNLFYTIPTALG
jgi:hypothetical protein